MNSTAPLITLILCSRNDSYMGNSKWRLETSINLALLNAKKANMLNQVEIIVADWGSDIPLSDVLVLVAESKNVVKFVHIPESLAKKEQKDSKFPEVIALNAAARRASGQYIGRIDNDTVVGYNFFTNFRNLHDNDANRDLILKDSFLFVERKSIPFRISRLSMPLVQISKFIERFKKHFKVESATDWGKEFWWSPVGIMIFHRDIWQACRGYDERLIYWGWMEGDLALRLGQKHSVIEFSNFVGHHFYHLEHYPSLTAYKDRNGPATPRKKNEPVFDNLTYSANDEGWGMYTFNEVQLKDYHPNSSISFASDTKAGIVNYFLYYPRISFALIHRKVDQLKISFVPFLTNCLNQVRIFFGGLRNNFLRFLVS